MSETREVTEPTPSPADPDIQVAAAAIARWGGYWAEARKDGAWVERHRLRDEKRRAVLPEMRDLVARFLEAEISLGEFRDTFDRKTRNEWDLFGLKGPSSAMFLNALVKHLPTDISSSSLFSETSPKVCESHSGTSNISASGSTRR